MTRDNEEIWEETEDTLFYKKNFSGTSLLVFVRLNDTRCEGECFYIDC